MSETECMEWLRDAYRCALRKDNRGYRRQMKRVQTELDHAEASDALRGEFVFASSFACGRDLDALQTAFGEALRLLGGPSRLLAPHPHLFGDAYNVYACCNVQPGHGDENAQKIARLVALFSRLTGGGQGTDVCYHAQLAYYRGELDSARSLAMQAFGIALRNGQGLVALCATETLACIAKHRLDVTMWEFAYGYIAAVAEGTYGNERACREQAETLRCILELSLGFLRGVPAWIQQGDFGAIATAWGYEMVEDKIVSGTLPNAMIARIQYDSYRGEPVRALQTIDTMQKLYGMSDVILNAYLEFFRAGCYSRLHDTERMSEALEGALTMLAPDGLWLIASEFAPAFSESLYSAVNKIAPSGLGPVRKLGEDYWSKLSIFRERFLCGASAGLTKREQEVSALIAKGLTNGEIASRLGIRERTVKSHVTSIFSKYSISRRGQLNEAIMRTSDAARAIWTTEQ